MQTHMEIQIHTVDPKRTTHTKIEASEIKASVGPGERRSPSRLLSCLTGITVYSSVAVTASYVLETSYILGHFDRNVGTQYRRWSILWCIAPTWSYGIFSVTQYITKLFQNTADRDNLNSHFCFYGEKGITTLACILLSSRLSSWNNRKAATNQSHIQSFVYV